MVLCPKVWKSRSLPGFKYYIKFTKYKMNIGYFGDGPWSHEALKKILLTEDCFVKFIVPRYVNPDINLKKIAKENNIDFFSVKEINSSKTIKKINSYNCDLLISMSFDQIIKKKLINLTSKGFINCHAGALPFYRGRNVLNWALINDEKYFGITVHYIDEGIDTGDIILQEKFRITDMDDYASLLKTAYFNCSKLLLKSINLIKSNKVKRKPQVKIDPIGSYFKKRTHGDEYISWDWTSRQIFNFIRSITYPGPIARARIYDKEVFFVKSKLVKNFKTFNNPTGSILKITKEEILIKTIDSVIQINDYHFNHNERFDIKVNDTFY